MKKLLPISLIAVSILLVSCGRKPNLDDVIVTPETPIVNNSQSAKVCQPVIKYLECSLGKVAEAEKANYQKAIANLQREIDNDEPSKIAQKCDSMIKVLQSKADVVSKNGCFVESAYTTTPPEAKKETPTTPETPKV